MALTPEEQAELELLELEFGSGSATAVAPKPKPVKPVATQPQPQQKPTLTPSEQKELQGLEKEFGTDKPVPAITQPGQGGNPLAALYAEHGIAALSASEESANRSDSFSYNKDRSRNAGKFQFHQMNMPMIIDWAKEAYPEIATNLSGFQPGTRQFETQWTKVAAKDPETFAQFERNAAIKFFYEPGVDAYTSLFGMDEGQLSEAERMAIFSTSIQHGGYRQIFANMKKYLGKSSGSTSDRLDALYRARTQYAPEHRERYARERDLVRPYESAMDSGQLLAGNQPMMQTRGLPQAGATSPTLTQLLQAASANRMQVPQGQGNWMDNPGALMESAKQVPGIHAMGEMAATSGLEYAGRAAGSSLGPVGTVVGGALGGMTGKVISDKVQGKPFSLGGTLMEGALTLLPDVVADPLAALYRKVLSGTKHGVKIGADKAAEWLLTHGQQAFLPIAKDYMDANFKLLRSAGAQIDADVMIPSIQAMPKKQFKALLDAVPAISSGMKGEYPSAGEILKDALQLMREGKSVANIPLDWLAHVRTQARLSPEAKRLPAVQDAMDQLVDAIDTVFKEGKFVDKPGYNQMQTDFQFHYARYQEGIDFAEWLRREDIVTRTKGHGSWQLDLGKMVELLRVPGDNKLSQQVQQSLLRPENAHVLAQLEEFTQKISGKGIELAEAVAGKAHYDVKRRFRPTVNIEGNAFADSSGVVQFLSRILGSAATRERFMRIVAQKRGKLSAEDVMVLAFNAMRRENETNEYIISIGKEKEEAIKNSPGYRSLEKTLKGLLNQGAPL